MKVLDPQTALLTIGEVEQFLKSSKPRLVDKKIGAYNSVNLHNYNVVRKDLDTYIQGTTPYVLTHSPSETWMRDLVVRLKKYGLTKTEAFSLINLGVGLNEAAPPSAVGQSGEAHDEVNGNGQAEAEDVTNGQDDDGEEAVEESGLDRMLFGLVVEESDERFAGEEGEERIAEVLRIVKETIIHAGGEDSPKEINGK